MKRLIEKSYLVIVLIEQAANKLGRKDTTLNILGSYKPIRKIRDWDVIRKFRNKFVHQPMDYNGLYTLLNNEFKKIGNILEQCSILTGISNREEIDKILYDLLKFYKEHKE